MFDATFWIFFGAFFAAWVGSASLLYYGAKKLLERKEPQEAG